jgi:hypothetical protein
MQQTSDKFASLPLELQNHGFIRVLKKRVTDNNKLVEDIAVSEAK